MINQGGEFTATQGICSHEYFELDKGFLTAGTLTCALHLSRFDLYERRADRPAGRAAARDLPRRRRGRPGPDRGPGRAAPDQRGVATPPDGSRGHALCASVHAATNEARQVGPDAVRIRGSFADLRTDCAGDDERIGAPFV